MYCPIWPKEVLEVKATKSWGTPYTNFKTLDHEDVDWFLHHLSMCRKWVRDPTLVGYPIFGSTSRISVPFPTLMAFDMHAGYETPEHSRRYYEGSNDYPDYLELEPEEFHARGCLELSHSPHCYRKRVSSLMFHPNSEQRTNFMYCFKK